MNGDEYTGSFAGLQYSGYGEMSFASGDEYAGEWLHGAPHGAGVFRYAHVLECAEDQAASATASNSIHRESYDGMFVAGKYEGLF